MYLILYTKGMFKNQLTAKSFIGFYMYVAKLISGKTRVNAGQFGASGLSCCDASRQSS